MVLSEVRNEEQRCFLRQVRYPKTGFGKLRAILLFQVRNEDRKSGRCLLSEVRKQTEIKEYEKPVNGWAFLFIAVMAPALNNLQTAVVNSEHDSVFVIDSDTPVSGQISRERFRLSCAFISVKINILDQSVDFLQSRLVFALPLQIFRPGIIVPQFLHSSSPTSSCSFKEVMPASRLLILLCSSMMFSAL